MHIPCLFARPDDLPSLDELKKGLRLLPIT